MMKQNAARMGVLELAGIGFAAGVLGGSIAGFLGEPFDTIVPGAAAFGVVMVPTIWLSVGARLVGAVRRPRRALAVASANGLVA